MVMVMILIVTVVVIFKWLWWRCRNMNVTVNNRNVKKIGNVIPKLVHQTWKVKNPNDDFHRKLLSRHERMNPNWRFVFYDDQDIQEFLRQYFPFRVVNAYKKINPKYGASRADFFRYCVLYIYGGVYLDMKSIIRKKLDEMEIGVGEESVDLLIVGHWKDNVWREILGNSRGELMNWVIMSTPRHPLLLKIIENMTEKIENFWTRRYIYDSKLGEKYNATKSKYVVLETTGPLMMTRILNGYNEGNGLYIADDILDYFEYLGWVDYKRAYHEIGSIHYSEIEDDSLIM